MVNIDSYPKVDIKDSGIDWLGSIPKHWNIKKLKYVCTHIADKKMPGSDVIKISSENVESHTGKISNYYSDYETEGYAFLEGDILFNKLNVYLNKVVLCNFAGLSMGDLIVLRPHLIQNKYAHRVLGSNGFIYYVNSLSEGIKLPRAPVPGIMNTFVPIPPEKEQLDIANAINAAVTKCEHIIEKEKQRIKLLKEYRESLISNVVTGKVRITKDML